jgi:phosphoadenosine phosphosulfate reductase
MTRIALNPPIPDGDLRVPSVRTPRGYTARDAAILNWRFGNLSAEPLLSVAARHLFAGRLAVVTAFGADSALLLDMVARVDRHLPVIFLETGKNFPETLAYRDRLAAALGLTDLRSVVPLAEDLAREDGAGDLWWRDPDRCCALRKVLPLKRALHGFDAWVTGRKRFQGGRPRDPGGDRGRRRPDQDQPAARLGPW